MNSAIRCARAPEAPRGRGDTPTGPAPAPPPRPRPDPGPAPRRCTGLAAAKAPGAAARSPRSVAARAAFLPELAWSTAAVSAVAGIAVATAEDKGAELARIVEGEDGILGSIPPTSFILTLAIVLDAALHTVPEAAPVYQAVAEVGGANVGVCYLMSILLSSQYVDPLTLAPRGTLANAEKSEDNRNNVRVPFTRIIPTVAAVVDPSNEGFTGAGWEVKDSGLPRLPVNAVAAVVLVGSSIVLGASHAPVLREFMPHVLSAAWAYAVAGAGLDRRVTAGTPLESA